MLVNRPTTIAAFSLITVDHVDQVFHRLLMTLNELVESCPDFFKLMRFSVREKADCRELLFDVVVQTTW